MRKDNTTGYSGISLVAGPKPYRVRVHIASERFHVGYYANIEEAVKAKDEFIADHAFTVATIPIIGA